MVTSLLLNPSAASRRQLTHYLQRTGWLNVGQSGAFTEDTRRFMQSGDCQLIFLRLSDPDEQIPDEFLESLRSHPAVVVTSPYPRQLFQNLTLQPLDFLTEPYSFERFAACMEKFMQQHG